MFARRLLDRVNGVLGMFSMCGRTEHPQASGVARNVKRGVTFVSFLFSSPKPIDSHNEAPGKHSRGPL